MLKTKVLLIGASDRIVGGHSIQAREIINYFSRHQSVETRRYDIDAKLPDVLRRFPYIRTIINEIVYLISLFPKARWADVLHIYSASYWSFLLAPAPAILLGRLLRKWVILNYHSGEADDHLSKWGILVKPILRLADVIIVPSEYLKKIFTRHGLKVRVVPNSVDLRRFERYSSDGPLPLHILCTRNFEDHYRVDRVIKAFSKIKAEIKEARLTLIGDGSYRHKLEELVSRLKLHDIVFVGQIDNKYIPEYYKQANLYLNASVIDNMPLSLMEAMSAGLIIVSTAPGGIPYLVKDRLNGILVSSNDPDSLSREVVSIYHDPERWNKIRANAIEYSKRFRTEVVCKEWETNYVKPDKRVKARNRNSTDEI